MRAMRAKGGWRGAISVAERERLSARQEGPTAGNQPPATWKVSEPAVLSLRGTFA
jgi:hypothetical protein